jgi:hypothetical protein
MASKFDAVSCTIERGFVMVGYNDAYFFSLFSSIEVLALVIKFLTAAMIRYFVVRCFFGCFLLTEVESL